MKHSLSTERALIERAREHDESAFAALVELYTGPLYRIVHRMLPDHMEAESIVQETFWRFWQALPRYATDRPLLPYLATIASNLVRDRLRRDRRIEEWPVDELPQPSLREDAGVERLVEDQRTRERLVQCVQQLPFAYRSVIALRYEAGMSYEQIAEALSLPINTVRTHLRRAKEVLRRQLEETGDG